jgi:predicted phage terminase large subunit-like protein
MCVVVAAAGGRAWWIGPSYPVAGIGWRLLKSIVAPIPGIEIRESERMIYFPSGGIVQVKSADRPDSLRGESLDFVVFDEVADIKEDAWFEGIRPSLADRKGKALFIGTPRGMDNWFYELFIKAQADETGVWEAFTAPTLDNPYIDPDEIEAAREDMHPIIFNQEHLAEFVVAGGTVFNASWEKWYKLVGDQYTYDSDSALILDHDDLVHEACSLKSCVRFATVDMAVSTRTSADYTVISSWALTPKRRLALLDFDRRRMEGPDLVPAMQKMRAKWRLAYVGIERSSFQLSIVQQARRAGMPVRELRADTDKLSRAYTAAAHQQGGKIWWRRSIPVMNDFASEVRNFPLSKHDDCVDTVSYASVMIDSAPTGPQIVSW